MPTNIEIKARVSDYTAQLRLAEEIADVPPQQFTQEDTFFPVPHGRLKLREFADGSGELIQYDRPDTEGPKTSAYALVRTDDPTTLKRALAVALGVRAVVRKTRTLLLCGRTRLHFDEVEGLGNFIELEVVLADGQSAAEGEAIAQALMKRLGIRPEDLLASAYVDMLEG
ncbi:MAG: class IV adenylate cyclase [Bacteroidetes bacterium]|nr:class IV adenylate cyclase [Bacteroidota bacterium]